MSIKRLCYFDKQFLHVEDFQDEQAYHLGMRRRHNRELHTWGIVEGLEVTRSTSVDEITVAPGFAIDSEGREIVLSEEKQLDWSGFPGDKAWVIIGYKEKDEQKIVNKIIREARTIEDAEISFLKGNFPVNKLVLARVKRTDDSTTVDASKRRHAGMVGGDLEALSLTLTDSARSNKVRMQIDGQYLRGENGLPVIKTDRQNELRINPAGKYRKITLSKSVAISTGGLAIGSEEALDKGKLEVTKDAFLATGSGKVGIGTTKPEHTLDVKGSIRAFKGPLRAGKDKSHYAELGYDEINDNDNAHAYLSLSSGGKMSFYHDNKSIMMLGSGDKDDTYLSIVKETEEEGADVEKSLVLSAESGDVRALRNLKPSTLSLQPGGGELVIHRDKDKANQFEVTNDGLVRIGQQPERMPTDKKRKLVIGGNLYVDGQIIGHDLSFIGNLHLFSSGQIKILWEDRTDEDCTDVTEFSDDVPREARGAILKVLVEGSGSFICADSDGLFNMDPDLSLLQNGLTCFSNTAIGGMVFCPFGEGEKFYWRMVSLPRENVKSSASVIGWF